MSGETIAVFGASGRTGKYVLKYALKEGFTVKAMARTPSKIEMKDPNLTIIEGDFANEEAIKTTLKDADYVICCAGAVAGKKYPTDIMVNFVRTLYEIFESSKKPKVFLYQAGAFSPKPDGTPQPMMLNIMRYTIGCLVGLTAMINDNSEVINFVASKDVTTIVTRPGMLVDPPKGAEPAKLEGSDKPEMGSVTFEELGKFTVSALKQESLYGTYPFCKKV